MLHTRKTLLAAVVLAAPLLAGATGIAFLELGHGRTF